MVLSRSIRKDILILRIAIQNNCSIRLANKDDTRHFSNLIRRKAEMPSALPIPMHRIWDENNVGRQNRM